MGIPFSMALAMQKLGTFATYDFVQRVLVLKQTRKDTTLDIASRNLCEGSLLVGAGGCRFRIDGS